MSLKSNISNAIITAAEMRSRQPQTLDLLQLLVELESPSDNKAGVDRCVDVTAGRAEALGGRVRRHRQREFGDLLEVRFGRVGRSAKPIMLLGHLDTVWPAGTLEKMPFRVEKGRVWGPGTLDMKAGVAMAFNAI